MKTLFNDNWQFAEISLNENDFYKNGEKILFEPEAFLEQSYNAVYEKIELPHDWQIFHVKDLYKNSVGCYKKTFNINTPLSEHVAIAFEGVYMNSAVWVNGKLAGKWKYGYSNFEFDISDFIHAGENEILVLAVYQHCNTRWYSGAGIFRDVYLISTGSTYLESDGGYFTAVKNESVWNCQMSYKVFGNIQNSFVKYSLIDMNGNLFFNTENIPVQNNGYAESSFSITNPEIWDIENPYFYILKTELFGKDCTLLDSDEQHCGFKTAVFDKDKGFFLNGRHLKINGACHHHDHGCFGSAFSKNALKRQFLKLKDMGVNAIRCSHNPPPKDWLDLCDELGLLIDDEVFDMWETNKTPFDYGNYFNDWCQKEVTNWVKKGINHPALIMWSIGNEIQDTQTERGLEITKNLYKMVRTLDYRKNAPITIASNWMATEGAQKCADEIDAVGYNYLEYLYFDHHKNHPDWKIYGSETSSTIQSRGIYHFPEELKLVTFSDGQCSCLGNCTTTWGGKNTQTVITNDRDCQFSMGQFIWTGWDYIGEPTPYHTKNSYFGQIDTAGFPKDTFYLYKSEWAGKKAEPFVHLLPYWDWNEGQIIDVKAYTNYDSVELFFNGKSLGRQEIDHVHGMNPFGKWKVEYHKGEIKAVAYDKDGNKVAEDIKRSFEDPANIVMVPEKGDFGDLFFVDLMTTDKNGELVENARNYITFNVTGNAELVGMDNGDSTDFDEYKSDNGNTHTRKLFANRAVAVIKAKKSAGKRPSFVITATSAGLPTVSMKYDGQNWISAAPYMSIRYVEDFIPVRKIELIAEGKTELTSQNKSVKITAKILPENASVKDIEYHAVLKECVPSDYVKIENGTVYAVCDGECILRCSCKNGGGLEEILSDLPISVKGVAKPTLNPYKLIEACRFTDWGDGKKEPVVSLESGISNRDCGACWVSFDNVDFGDEQADKIHLPIFSFNTEVPIEVWDGKPGSPTSECLGKFTYTHESVYNTFNENVFTLNKKLSGLHTISIYMKYEHELKGFYFER